MSITDQRKHPRNSPGRSAGCGLRRIFSSVLLTVVAALLSTGPVAVAADAEFQRLQIGFESVGRVGSWLPVTATVAGLPDGAAVELHVTTADPRGNQIVEVAAFDSVQAGEPLTLRGYVRFGRLEGTAQVAVVAAAENPETYCRLSVVHGESVVPSPAEQDVQTSLQLWQYDVPFLLTVGDPAGIPEVRRNAKAVAQTVPPMEPPLVVLQVNSLADLPDSVLGYDCIDHLLFSDEFELSEAQFQALKLWVQSGGHWLVVAGETLPDLLQTKAGKWLQPRFGLADEPVPVRILSGLESFVSGAGRVPTFYDSIPQAVVQTEQARVLVRTLEGPLIARLGAGAGVVTFVSIELNTRPLSGWRSLPQLYETLILGQTMSRSSSGESGSARISSSGVSDLATQLMATVDAAPTSGRWSTWCVMALVFGYLLLIGPLDYLLVVSLLKRPHLTWITFPLFLLAGVWGLLAIKSAADPGTARLNQLHVVDVLQDQDEQRLLVRSWMSLSSADTRRADLAAEPQNVQPLIESDTVDLSLSWAGRPEDVYGGLYRTGGVPLGRQQYRHYTSDNIGQPPLSEVPLLTDGSYELLSQWTARAAGSLLTADVSVSGLGLLEGTLAHQLPGELTDWIVIHGNRLYRPSGTSADLYSLQTGESLTLNSDGVLASDLKAFLNGARLVASDSQDRRSGIATRATTQVITPYDPLARDPKDILTMLSLYNSAGGKSYVGLTQHQLRRLELSDTIRLNYAVLLGRISEPVTELLLDGQPVSADQSVTLVRMLIPVDRRPARRQGLTDEELRSQTLPPEEVNDP